MRMRRSPNIYFFFFFNDTATTEIYTLSLHDALPILRGPEAVELVQHVLPPGAELDAQPVAGQDRKSTRLNSSHSQISYAVFCLKKKKVITTVFPSRPASVLSERRQTVKGRVVALLHA